MTDLLEIIKADLNQVISFSVEDIEEITNGALVKAGQVNVYKDAEENKKAIEKRLSTIDSIIIKLYGDNAAGKVSDDILSQTVSALSKEATDLKAQLKKIENKRSIGNEIVDNYDIFFNMAKQFTHIDELTEEIVRTFIDRIEIGKKILSWQVKMCLTHKK